MSSVCMVRLRNKPFVIYQDLDLIFFLISSNVNEKVYESKVNENVYESSLFIKRRLSVKFLRNTNGPKPTR